MSEWARKTDGELESIRRTWYDHSVITGLIDEVKRLRAVAEEAPLSTEVRQLVEDTIGRMGKLYARLKWTSEKPTQPGFYLCMDCDSTEQWAVELVRHVESLQIGEGGAWAGFDLEWLHSCKIGLWAGPIPIPAWEDT